jgi:hypothetical protein
MILGTGEPQDLVWVSLFTLSLFEKFEPSELGMFPETSVQTPYTYLLCYPSGALGCS